MTQCQYKTTVSTSVSGGDEYEVCAGDAVGRSLAGVYYCIKHLSEAIPGVRRESMMPESFDYVTLATRTENTDRHSIAQRMGVWMILRAVHALLGMMTELGELADVFKRHIFYGKPIDWVNVKEELGDQSWYSALMHDVAQMKIVDVQRTNIAKLLKRYPEKFTERHALERDLAAELESLQDQNKKGSY
jgi:NTP pyrophosphatase (non-canonical NTP hydrolase)